MKQRNLVNQYLIFQMPDQGPYYGQAGWLAYCTENLEPYRTGIRRIMGVLEIILAQDKDGWFVGDKCTFADLEFLSYNRQSRGVPRLCAGGMFRGFAAYEGLV
ncbi:uncharacterized protein K460DRAFT_410012 [Cucurbitaria berberidis CBS 394.84]|uniref:GST C-terminal domain-containing protein n=1 Tax=Cucurbitaria berberidis CBS 394.84 TaxID=1168544 RepID=A0A9P4GB80_9PLEO|nr:uncharacterized protein K460DRAFT_410012 [Cucurbitaria berberidis CBS 394.84]KAF1842613.1 hypothetical protein K460DRAFT_410012 [Cucurbitaria berberidis CBS 394.84]